MRLLEALCVLSGSLRLQLDQHFADLWLHVVPFTDLIMSTEWGRVKKGEDRMAWMRANRARLALLMPRESLNKVRVDLPFW